MCEECVEPEKCSSNLINGGGPEEISRSHMRTYRNERIQISLADANEKDSDKGGLFMYIGIGVGVLVVVVVIVVVFVVVRWVQLIKDVHASGKVGLCLQAPFEDL